MQGEAYVKLVFRKVDAGVFLEVLNHFVHDIEARLADKPNDVLAIGRAIVKHGGARREEKR